MDDAPASQPSALVETMKLRQLTSGFAYSEDGEVIQVGTAKLTDVPTEPLDEVLGLDAARAAGAERLLGRGHVRGVERPGYLQRRHPGPGRRLGDELLQLAGGSGHHDLTGSVVVRRV